MFTSIVGKDFYMPKDFVHARNANGRVAMGLHGYRIGIGEYGRTGMAGCYRPRSSDGRPASNGAFTCAGSADSCSIPDHPLSPERWDGRMKPGELQSGGYGFYYKGGQRDNSGRTPDGCLTEPAKRLSRRLVTRERSSEPAKPYKELVSSPVYFSNEKWQECLSSHGLIVDAEQQTLTVQSESVSADFVYDLTAEETAVLTSNSIEEHPVEKRIELLNNIIAADYQDKVTMADLGQ